MGIYDRDYGRDMEPGVHLGVPQSMTIRLVIITACVYGLQLFIGEAFTRWFVMTDDWFFQPWNGYRLLSYGFLHAPNDLWHIVINMLVFWMFGQELERKYGSREFLYLYLWAIVFAGLVWSLIEVGYPGNLPMLGASGGVSAIFALYALNFPHRKILFMFFIPMPMWVAAAIGLLMDINHSMDRSGNIAGSAHIAGAIAGLYYYKLGFSPFRWIADRVGGVSFKLPRSGPKLRVHDPEEFSSEIDLQVDAILQKINEQGQESLTASERKLLEKASQKYQRKHQ